MKPLLTFAFFLVLSITGCSKKETTLPFGDDGRITGRLSAFDDMPGWGAQEAQAGLGQLRAQCAFRVVKGMESICRDLSSVTDAQRFFETRFLPIALSEAGESEGLMTGYYEPLLQGSMRRSDRYPYPLYARPDDLLGIDLTGAYADLKGRKLRGRLIGDRIVAYPSRADINAKGLPADVLCYVSDDVDRFFLQVQGSGRVRLDNGRTIFVGYADQNGHPYHSIGKKLIDAGAVSREAMSLQSIRNYLRQHPGQKQALLESNPSFVFFAERPHAATGALGMELTPLRSLAVDPTRIPLGYPLFFSATDPLSDQPLRHLALAQDTGGAIRGQVRADLFCGFGQEAEARAGQMKSPLRMWLLVPKR